MSNPAVIELASTYIGNTEVRLEDNFGEAIHFHFGFFRVDLTVKEFLELADRMEDAVRELITAKNFRLEEFDPKFISFYNEIFLDLESVSIDEVRLGDIIALKYDKLPYYRTLEKCRDYKALMGDTRELNSYKSQVNKLGQSNEERLLEILASIKENGYPFNGQYIILRNNQNVILDGQHRASCLLFLYGKNHKVPVMRFHFKNEKYNITDWHPWRRVLYRKGIDFLRRISHRVSGNGKIDL